MNVPTNNEADGSIISNIGSSRSPPTKTAGDLLTFFSSFIAKLSLYSLDLGANGRKSEGAKGIKLI